MFSLCRTSFSFLKYIFAIYEKISSLPLQKIITVKFVLYIIMLHVHKYIFKRIPTIVICYFQRCSYVAYICNTKCTNTEKNWLRLYNIYFYQKLKDDFWPFMFELHL